MSCCCVKKQKKKNNCHSRESGELKKPPVARREKMFFYSCECGWFLFSLRSPLWATARGGRVWCDGFNCIRVGDERDSSHSSLRNGRRIRPVRPAPTAGEMPSGSDEHRSPSLASGSSSFRDRRLQQQSHPR